KETGKETENETENEAKIKTTLLPEPLDEFSYFNGHYESISGAELGTGWNYVESWKPAIRCGTRQKFVNVPMLECVEAGKELTFRFRGRGVGIFTVSGPDTGIIEWSVDGAPWKSKDFYTPWSGGLFLPWAQVLEAELTDTEHVLKLRLSPEKNARSTGTSIRIVHFLVN
ncbi:MAG: SGNH/GDSL hydrolase family protein, partial [Planctomycetia bacterium]|nr:SGNH/GDSL hydrolase family protein [Planctomycetia bacterium]